MNRWKILWTRFRSLWRRTAVKRDIDEELRFHLERRAAENIAAGMAPEAAEREARKRFGNWQSVREECREARGAAFAEDLLQDVRFGFRMLRKNTGFAAIGALTLALGVAGNVVIFSVYNTLYLRPFPAVDSSRLVDLDETAPRWNLEYTGLAYPDFNSWREHNRSFAGMCAWKDATYNLSFEGGAERVSGLRVTYDFASVLGVKPVLGRLFTPEDDRPGSAKVLLLGNGFWRRQFGGRKDIIGQTVRLNYESFTVVGILPPEKELIAEGEFWVPLAMDPNELGQGWFLNGIGRLKDGVTLGQAREDLRSIHAGLVQQQRASDSTAPRATFLRDRFFGDHHLTIQVLLGAVSVVLLIACGDVAALMLARGLARSRELALRLSLGATRRRLAQLIGVESLTLAGAGGLAGLGFGYWGLKLLLHAMANKYPRWMNFDLDWRVWLFIAALVMVSAVLGALPVVASASKLDMHAALQSSAQPSTTAGGGRRGLHILVVAELALTLVVMVQAGLLVETFRSLQRADPGFRIDHLLVYGISLPYAKYKIVESRVTFFQEHLERLRSLPGVVSASAITLPPLSGRHEGRFYTIENAPPQRPGEPQPVVLERVACPGYFETMGIALRAGRSFTEQDGRNQSPPVVIVDESFAKRSWPSGNPIGKRIRSGATMPWLTVIGVAQDVKHYGLDKAGHPGVYLPYAQAPQNEIGLVVRSAAAPLGLVSSVRAIVRPSDPDLPVFGAVSMDEQLAQSIMARRLAASLFAIFSGVALLMAIGGIYGVFSYMVNRRTQEVGLRLALGAQRRDVLWLVVRQGLKLAAIGIGTGLLGSLLIIPVTRNLLFGVSPFDPIAFGGVAFLLAGVAALACWVPARRAAQVEPMKALRYE